jgi:hypothetical protein
MGYQSALSEARETTTQQPLGGNAVEWLVGLTNTPMEIVTSGLGGPQ